MRSAQLARLMGRVSWWIVGVPLACYFLVQIMRAIGRRRGIEPTEEQVGAYEFVKHGYVIVDQLITYADLNRYINTVLGNRIVGLRCGLKAQVI